MLRVLQKNAVGNAQRVNITDAVADVCVEMRSAVGAVFRRVGVVFAVVTVFRSMPGWLVRMCVRVFM